MRLQAPVDALDFSTRDIYGEPFRLSDLRGGRVMLSFFRDAACPFCNLRIYEMTHEYTAWKKAGLTVVAVFSSPADQVRAFVARRPRPFHMISDPDLEIYNRYGVEHSATALFKAMLFRMPRIAGGIATGGRPRPNPNVRLVPADFLINEEGQVVDTWYGRNTSDHMPLERVHDFAESGRQAREAAYERDAQRLAEVREELEKSRERRQALESRCEKLEAQVTDLSQRNETLSRILDAYKQAAGQRENAMEAAQRDGRQAAR